MLRAKIEQAIEEKFNDIIDHINGVLFEKIKDIIPGDAESVRIDIYSIFDGIEHRVVFKSATEIENYYINFGAKFTIEKASFEEVFYGNFLPEVALLKTQNGTTYIETFDNITMLERIISYYNALNIDIEFHYTTDLIIRGNRTMDWISDHTDYEYKSHPRLMYLKLSQESYETGLLKERVDLLIESKFPLLTQRIENLLIEEIRGNPEKGKIINLDTRLIFDYPPDDPPDDQNEPYYGTPLEKCCFGVDGGKPYDTVGYSEIFGNSKIIQQLKNYFIEKGVEIELNYQYPWSEMKGDCTKIQLDLHAIRDDNSELHTVTRDIEYLIKEKNERLAKTKEKELSEYTDKIDGLVLKEAVKFISKESDPYQFRASLIFQIPNKFGSYYEAFGEFLQEGIEDPDWEYYDDMGELQEVYSGSQHNENIDLGYEVDFTHKLNNLQWDAIQTYYKENGLELSWLYLNNGADQYYNYIQITSLKDFIPQKKDEKKSDSNIEDGTIESSNNRWGLKVLYFFVVFVVLLFLITL